MNEVEFQELAKKKATIKQLQEEINKTEKILQQTFLPDVEKFFLDKGYDIIDRPKTTFHYVKGTKIFNNVRQIDEKSTFKPGYEPCYIPAGKNKLVIKFEWWLQKNYNISSIYWYPEKQTLEDFYKKRLKKYIKLPIKKERQLKINKLNNT